MDENVNILELIRFEKIPLALLVLGITVLLVRYSGRLFERLQKRFVEWRLQLHQAATIARFLIYLGGVGTLVPILFRLSENTILALGGSVAVALGFAFKDLAGSLIAGVIILIDRPFQVGDRVSFGGFYGEIVEIGLRSVRLVTLDDSVVTIPNNKFLTEAVSSGNDGALDMLIQMDFFVGADQPVKVAKRIVSEAITSTRYAFQEKPWAVLVNQVLHEGYFAVRLRAKVYVLDVRYEKALESDVTERVLEGFEEAGIRPPAMLYRGFDKGVLKPAGAPALGSAPAPAAASAQREA